MPSPEQIAKLPKWAQQHIATLTANLEWERDRLRGGPSDTIAGPFATVPQPLRNGERVRFLTGTSHQEYVDVQVRDTRTNGRYVEVMAGDTLQVEPQAANHVRLRTARR